MAAERTEYTETPLSCILETGDFYVMVIMSSFF